MKNEMENIYNHMNITLFQITGHKSMSALLSYDDELSDEEYQHYSDILTRRQQEKTR